MNILEEYKIYKEPAALEHTYIYIRVLSSIIRSSTDSTIDMLFLKKSFVQASDLSLGWYLGFSSSLSLFFGIFYLFWFLILSSSDPLSFYKSFYPSSQTVVLVFDHLQTFFCWLFHRSTPKVNSPW